MKVAHIVSAAAVLLSAALPSGVSAFHDTVPFLAYHSRSLGAGSSGADLFAQLSAVSRRDARGPALYSRDLAQALVHDQRSLCDLDGIALIEVEDLHSRTFASLTAENPLKERLQAAQAKFGLQHVSERTGSAAREISRAVQDSCGGAASAPRNLIARVTGRSGNAAWDKRSELQEPSARAESSGARSFVRAKTNFRQLEDGSLASALAQFEAAHPNNLVLFTSREEPLSFPSQLARRATGLKGSKKSSGSKSGIFHRYQLFSTSILLSALILLLLVVPVVYLTVSLLGSIATPDRLGEKSRLTEMSKKAN